MRIGDMLVRAGLIDEMQLQTALSLQRQWGGKLGDILVEQGFLDEMMLWRGLSRQLDVPLVSLTTNAADRDVLALVSRDLCERLEIVPVARDERSVVIATSDPNNIGALDEVAFRIGLKVKTVLAPQREVAWAIRHHYRGDPQPCPPPRQRRTLPTDPPAPALPSAPPPPTLPAPPPTAPTPPPVLTTGPASYVGAASPDPRREPARAATPLAEIAQASGRPTWSAPAAGAAWGAAPGAAPGAEEQLRQANEVLAALVELCIQRGVFTREELRARIISLAP